MLGFALAVTSATALSLGVLVAWRGRRPGIVEWLKDAQRGNTGGAPLRRLRNMVVVTQLAVSVVLLVGAGLLGRSLSQLLHQNLGFRTDGVLAVQTSIPRPRVRYTQSAIEVGDPASLPRQAEFNERAIERLGALPGVTAAGGINGFPLDGGDSNGPFLIIRGDEPQCSRSSCRSSRIPHAQWTAQISRGERRVFRRDGHSARSRPACSTAATRAAHRTSRSSASHWRASRWPADDPIGVRIQFGGMDGDMTPFTIVGIVGDIREGGLDSQPPSMFYADYRQRPLEHVRLQCRAADIGRPGDGDSAARRILAEMAPEMPPRFRTVREAIDARTASRRFTLV